MNYESMWEMLKKRIRTQTTQAIESKAFMLVPVLQSFYNEIEEIEKTEKQIAAEIFYQQMGLK